MTNYIKSNKDKNYDTFIKDKDYDRFIIRNINSKTRITSLKY